MMQESVYTPGAGHSPGVLAGRDDLLKQWILMLDAAAVSGRVRAKDTILTGPRGVGKTVTMKAFADHAAEQGFEELNLQAVSGQSGLTESLLQRARVRVASNSAPWLRVKDSLERLIGISLNAFGLGVSLTRTQEEAARLIDPGTLAEALAVLATEFHRLNRNGGLLITVDELQAASSTDLALLAATLQRLNVDFPKVVVVFAATGLPRVWDTLLDSGVTHPDRLFQKVTIPTSLEPQDAMFAIIEPARRAGVLWEPAAAERVVQATNGHPAHLQLVADAVWRSSTGPVITETDAKSTIPGAVETIRETTLAPIWDRMPARQMEYLAVLSALGGVATTKQMSRVLQRPAADFSWLRDELLKSGEIYSSKRGEISIAVPALIDFALEEYDESVAGSPYDPLSLEEIRRRVAGLGA